MRCWESVRTITILEVFIGAFLRFPPQMANNTEFDSMPWLHHGVRVRHQARASPRISPDTSHTRKRGSVGACNNIADEPIGKGEGPGKPDGLVSVNYKALDVTPMARASLPSDGRRNV